MAGVCLTLITILTSLLLLHTGSSFAAEKSLADILKEKGILTEEEYQEAVKAEEAQKAEEARKTKETQKALEETQKALEEAQKAAAVEQKPPSPPAVGYSSKDGFFLQTPDQKYRLTLQGFVRTQLRLYENNTSQDNEFKIRHARLILRGYYGKYWQSEISAELTMPGGKLIRLADLNCSYLPYLQFQVGQYKAPFSREFLIPCWAPDLIERSMVTDSGGMTPKFDIGVMLHSPNAFNGLLWYGVGVFNGAGDNNGDTNDDKDLVGRVVLAPFALTQMPVLRGFEIGGSFETGRETADTLGYYKFQPQLPTFWPFFKEITYRGQRDRYGAELAYKLGPFKLWSEFIYQSLEREKQVRVDPATSEIVNSGGKLIDAPDLIAWGWYVLGTYFVWGDENGGIQLGARYEQMDVDDKKAPERFREANPMGKNSYANRWGNDLNLRGNTADVLTLGINYFVNSNVKFSFAWFYQTLDNKFTTDKIEHNHDGGEVFTGGGGVMNACWLLAQVKW